MRRLLFDLDVLRSLTLGVELGSFAKAADRLGRSTSAISAQMKKLEDQVGTPVLRKAGRGLVPTSAGDVLLAYARRLLELNDEAAEAVRGETLDGEVRLGIQEDFGERLLPDVLASFARIHPRVCIVTRMTRNAALLSDVERGRLDLALAWEAGRAGPHVRHLRRLPMRWIGSAGPTPFRLRVDEPVSLVVLEAPCVLRTAAIDALDRANIPWRVAFTSASLAGLWAAVTAGLGVTVRTAAGLPGGVELVDRGLPALPTIGLAIYRAEAKPSAIVRALERLLVDHATPSVPLRSAATTSHRSTRRRAA